MERSHSSHEVADLFEIIENSLLEITKQGHIDDGYCLACDDEPFNALKELEFRVGKRPDWPKQLHQQYMAVLDERDTLQAQVENLQDELSQLRWRMDGLEK